MVGECAARPRRDTAEVLSYALFPAVYKSYRRAVDHGLTGDVLTTAALGVGAGCGAPTVRAGAPRPGGRRGVTAWSSWAYEGRARSHSQRRWRSMRRRPRARG